MCEVHARSGRRFIGFGDSAFPLGMYMQCMLKGMVRRTQQGKRFNDAIAHVRVSVENAFADVLNKW
eukprot:821711-Rhodomonas_salina.1